MLTVRQASDFLNLSYGRVKQILHENDLEFIKYDGINNGLLRIPPETIRKMVNLRGYDYHCPKVLTLGTQKGGVGKTFLSTNLAVVLALRGLKVLLVDMDPEACATNTLLPSDADYMNLPTMLEVYKHGVLMEDAIVPSKYPNLDLIASKGKVRGIDRITLNQNPKKLMADKIKKLKKKYDLIIFDLAPNFTPVTASCYLCADLIIQPAFPNIYSLESVQLTLDDLKELCQEFDAPMPQTKILLNAFRASEKASRETRHELESKYKDQLLPFEIGKHQDVSNLINEGLSVLDTKTKATPDIVALANYVCRLEKNESVKNAGN